MCNPVSDLYGIQKILPITSIVNLELKTVRLAKSFYYEFKIIHESKKRFLVPSTNIQVFLEKRFQVIGIQIERPTFPDITNCHFHSKNISLNHCKNCPHVTSS